MTPPILNDRYRVMRVLAQGGFGETFLAEDSFLPSSRLCVLKQLKLVAENPKVHELVQNRFRREAAILEDLGRASQQIPELYAYFEEDDQFYLVQEWIEGQTLAEWLRTHGIFSEIAVRRLLEQILPVLGFIHSRGIIHRDIKPSNIILRLSDHQPILIDFGAVKETVSTVLNSQGHTLNSIVIGTPGYMAPEQAAGRPIFSSDLFSLGITAIYLLTGKQPQSLETDPKTGELTWRNHVPLLSSHLADVIDRSIQYHPRDRFSSAEEMLVALQTVPDFQAQISHSSAVDSSPPPATITPLLPTTPPPTAPLTQLPISVVSAPAGFNAPPPSHPSNPPQSASLQPFSGSTSGSASARAVSSEPSSDLSSVSSVAPPNPTPPITLALGAVPPTEYQPPKRRRTGRIMIASAIAAGLAVIGGGSYVYYLQEQPSQQAKADLEEVKALQATGDHQACIAKAEAFTQSHPDQKSQVQSLLSACTLARDKATLQAAVNIASQPKADLAAAIDKAKQIPETSPVRADAQKYMLKWQTTLLQNYLSDESLIENSSIADTIRRIKPKIEQITSDQITIRYNSSSNLRYAESAGIRLFTAKFMELLQGNGKDIPQKYDSFTELIVYPQPGTQQGVLTTDQWQRYLEKRVSLDQLLEEVEVTTR